MFRSYRQRDHNHCHQVMNDKLNNLISRHLSGNTSPDEDKKLQDWISQSETNRSEFERSRRLWETALSLKKDRDADVDAAWAEFQQIVAKAPARKRILFKPLRIAAGLALIMCLGILLWLALPGSEDNATLADNSRLSAPVPTETTTVMDTFLVDDEQFLDSLLAASSPTGPGIITRKRKAVKNVVMITIVTTDSAKAFLLPDNSVVFLNDHSTLRYEESFGINNRRVMLSGEAYFEPVKDTMALVVSCGKSIAKSGHAFFNVREDFAKREVEVIVVSGEVNFTGVGLNEYKKLVLKEGQRAVCTREESLQIQRVTSKDYRWWQKKNLRARLKRLFDKIRNTFR